MDRIFIYFHQKEDTYKYFVASSRVIDFIVSCHYRQRGKKVFFELFKINHLAYNKMTKSHDSVFMFFDKTKKMHD